TSMKVDVFPRPERAECAGQLFVTDYSQRAAEGKESGIAGKIGVRQRTRFEKRRVRLRVEVRIAKTTVHLFAFREHDGCRLVPQRRSGDCGDLLIFWTDHVGKLRAHGRLCTFFAR